MAFIDARDLPEATEIEADLIIIGGGLAGIALAKQWAGANKRVAILESGAREPDRETQSLYEGAGSMRAPDNTDINIDDYLVQSRFRGLGGSGNIWGGKLVPLDESDFAPRPWLPRSGWSITRAAMNPYYDRACDLFEVERFDRDWDANPEADRPPLRVDGFFSAPRRFTHLSGRADPEAFDRFRTDFANAENVTVYLNANVVELQRRRNGRRVTGLSIACLNGKRHTARGLAYVLATGGIENVRLLLASGLDHPLLGRCFMGHVTIGAFEENSPNTMLSVSDTGNPMTLYSSNARDVTHCVLAATQDGQQRFNIGNLTITLAATQDGQRHLNIENAATSIPAQTHAVLTLSAAVDRGAPSAPAARPMPCFFMSEQLPHPDSRITLDPASVDALGMPRVRLDWVYSRQDIENIERAVAAVTQTLGGGSIGRLCWPIARNQLLAAFSPSRHHMGTTRMAIDRDDGVVDENCRMHGVSNLYVAGSSVFPTSGIANPTLTLTALAMRLSDHLKHELGAR